jgi:phosphoheptose isomerase
MSVVPDVETEAMHASMALQVFPTEQSPTVTAYFGAYLDELRQAAASIDGEQLDRAAAMLVDAYTSDACVFTCGNGGSAAIANHMQCDHVKGVHAKTRMTPRVVSLSNSVELLTAIGNDLAFEDIFAHQLQCAGRAADVLVAISSSGRSRNIVRALVSARELGMRTIALTGFDGGDAKEAADVAIHVECRNYGIIEDVHQSVMHALAQFIQQSRMPAEAIAASVF